MAEDNRVLAVVASPNFPRSDFFIKAMRDKKIQIQIQNTSKVALRSNLKFSPIIIFPIFPLPKSIRMDDFQATAEEFSVEDAETIVKGAISRLLSSHHYKPQKVNDWSNNLIDSSLKELQSLNKPFKYAITTTIMQKNGAGMVCASSTYWDQCKDGLCKVNWENETMHCAVVVYGLSVNIDEPTEFD